MNLADEQGCRPFIP